MESYIKKKILKHLSKFTKGLSVDKISLSTLKGEGELANLELDEIVLQDVLDLPTWVTIKKATCNKVAIKIQWTKLKTHPICLYMDQIDIEMETCDEPRAPNNPSPFMSQGGDTKYGFAEKVVDGMSLTINSVTIRFISHAFHASFQLSRIRARSTTPQWKAADLRMTRIKDTERGMVLTFKEIDWQTLRIEADAVKTEKTNYVSTPVRLITNQSRIRIVIKKQLQDCSVVSSKLHLILDDLLWVLTDSQLKAMASYMQSLSKIIRKSTEQNKRDASAQPSPPSPQHHATQRPHAAASGTAQRNPQLEAVSKFFSKFDMVETSYHIFTRRLDLHLCDDTNPLEQEKFNRRTDGGAMQITFHRLMLDYYPYHSVGMNKKHWFRHNECMDARDQWAELLLAEFKHQLKEWKKATADAAEGQESRDGGQEEVRGQQPGVRGHKPRPKLMSSGIIFRLEDFELYQVSTSDTRHSTPKKFFSSDKKALYLPQEMSAVHLEYTEYYFPEGVEHPVPSPNIYGQINAIQLTLDYMTVLWANQFLLNVAQSMAAAPMDRQESVEEPAPASLHVDIRLEILMPKISLPAEKPVPDQPDRPQALVVQSSRSVLTNSRVGTNCTRDDLKTMLENFSASVLCREEERFPNKDGDFLQVCNEFWDEAMHDGISFDTSAARPPPIGSTNSKANVLRGERSKDVWLIYFEQFWVDFGDVASAKGRPLPFIDAIPLHLWICKPFQGQDDPSQMGEEGQTGGHIGAVSSSPSQVRGHRTLQSQRRRHQSGEADQSQHRRHQHGEADQSQHRKHQHGEADQSQHRKHQHGEADQSQHRRHRTDQRPASGSQSGMKSYQSDQSLKRPHLSDQSGSKISYQRTQSEPRGHSLRHEERKGHRGAQQGGGGSGGHSSEHGSKDRRKRDKHEQGSERHVREQHQRHGEHHQHHHGDEEARDEKRKRLMEYYRGGPTLSNHQEPARKEKSPGSEEDELVREMFSNQPPSKRLSSTFKTKSLSDSDSSPDQENVFMNGPVGQKGGVDAAAAAAHQAAAAGVFSVAEIPAFRERDHHRPPLDRGPPVSHHRGVIPEERPLHQDWEQRQQRPMLSRDRSLSSPELDKASAFERMLRGRSISVEEVLSSDDPADFDAGREFGRTEADSHMLLHTPSKVCGVVTHDQYLFLLRLQESIAQLQDCMEEDAVAIRGRPSNVSSSCIAACCRQVELSLILPSPPVGSRASGSAAGSTTDIGAASQQRRSSLQTDTLMVPGATTPRTTSPSPVDSGIAEGTTAGNGNHVAKSQSDTALMSLSSDEENNGGENTRKRRNLSSGERPKSFTEDGVTTLRKSPSRDGPDSGRGSGNVAESANERQENVRTDQSQQDRGLLGAMPTKQVPKLTVSDGTKEIAKDSPLFEKKFGKFSDFSAANIAAQLRIGLLSQSQLSLDEMSLDNFSLDNMSLDSTDSGDPYLMGGTEMSTLSVDTLSISSQGSRSAPVSHQSSFERGGDGEPTRQASLEDGRDGRPTVLAGDGEGSTRPKKVTLEYCDSESSTEEVSQSAGSAATIEETKKRKTATVLVLHLSDVGLELSNHQRDNFTKLQGQEISFEERREVDVQDFLAKISQRKRHRRHFKFRTMFPTEDSPSRRRRVKKDVPLPSATDVPPHVSARLESGPHAARYSPNAPKLGHLELQLQGAAGVVTMSTLTGVASLIEDEILTTPMPMRVDFVDSQLSLVDDGPPLNPGSPGSIPLDIHVDRATVVRMEDGIFHLTCVSPSPHLGVAVPGRTADHLLPGLQAGGHSSAAAAQVTALKEENDRLQREVARLREQQKSSMTSQLLSENLCLQGEKQQLKEELLDTQHALQEAEQERTTLLRTLEHVQEEMLQADREKNFLRDQLDRRSPRK